MTSLRGGGPRTRPQAHQNTFAFRHNPKSKKTATILSLPNEGLCQRCHDKIEWRKKYRKYKPLKAPAFCNYCKQKTVRAAYHVCCQPCAKERRVCAFCCETRALVSSASPGSVEEQRLKLEQSVAHLPLRKRKSILREFDQSQGAANVAAIMAKAAAMGDDDDDDFDFDDDEFEEEEEEEDGDVGVVTKAVAKTDLKGSESAAARKEGPPTGTDIGEEDEGEEEEDQESDENEHGN